MPYTPDSLTARIYDDTFSFHGSLDGEGRLLRLTGKVFADMHVKTDLLIGQRFAETVFWQSAIHVADLLRATINESIKGHQTKILIDFRVSAKKTIAVELSFYPQLTTNNRISEILFFALDVDTREAEITFFKKRSEQLLYAAESAGIGLWFWDLLDNTITSTPKCNAFYQLPPFELLTPESVLGVVHPDDAAAVIAQLREAQTTGEEYNIEYRVVHADNSIHRLRVRGKAFLDPQQNPISMMGMVREITERSDAEEELNRILDRERKALDEAEEANRVKDYFMAFVSHELRSPLNSILGWSKILLTKQVDDGTRRNALETIERSAKSQAKLIEDLVESARITSGKLRLDLRPTNLLNVVKNAFDSQKPAAETKHVSLIFNGETENADVFCDPMRVQQVFTNLLTNALKFTPEDGQVTIDLKKTNASAIVTVTDSGVGIGPDLLPKIFNKFVQADKTETRDKSGLGIGLTIVKTLVEKQGGTVRAESEGPGRGATFTVTLPLYTGNSGKLPEAPLMPVRNKDRSLKNLKILVVEDDRDSREVLKLFLEQNGAFVQTCPSVAEAEKILSQSGNFSFDLIVSDIAMPVEDGYSFIRKLRESSDARLSKMPAIALSAFANVENREQAITAGFQKYHTKPFDSDRLVSEIAELVR